MKAINSLRRKQEIEPSGVINPESAPALTEELRRLANCSFLHVKSGSAEEHRIRLEVFLSRAAMMLQQVLSVARTEDKCDALTGLHTRASLLQQVQWRIDSSHVIPRCFALLFVDIDGFKRINDSLGHVAADALLIEIAERIQRTVHAVPGSLVARLGGDEFVVLVGDVAMEVDAVTYAASLEFLLRSPFECSRQQVFLSASVGVAFASAGTYATAEQMLEDADIAMYRAKNAGKAQWAVFSKTMRAEACARLQLENDLRIALQNDQFEVYYQPKIRLRTGAVKGFEALLRWHHPIHGMVSPQAFIPVAEELGLIPVLGWWVIEQAVRQLARWRSCGLVSAETTMAVNVSPKQFNGSDLVGSIKELLLECGVPSPCFVVEITEGVLMHETGSAVADLHRLFEEGIGLDLDDFGTGYSSLSYLHRLPFRSIKIDRSFIRQMGTKPQSINLVESIIGLASSLQMAIIAEGVETEWQSQQLQAMGCLVGQGYLFSPPLPGNEIESHLKAGQMDATQLVLHWPRAIGAVAGPSLPRP